MSILVVETGAIVPLANCRVTLAEFKAYVGTIPLPALTDPEYERAIVLGARYNDGHYRARWLGFRVRPVGTIDTPAQTMEWPRLYVAVFGAAPGIRPGFIYNNYLPATSIPQRLKDADCEAALIALTTALAPILDPSVESEKLDVIETKFKANGKKGQIEYQHIDQLLSDYLTPVGCSTVTRG